MDATAPDLRSLAQGAYERGRRRLATRRALWALPFGAFALAVLSAPPSLALAATVALGVAFGWTQHRGQAFGRGGRDGLLVGLIPLTAPWVVESNHLCCSGGSCATNCLIYCAAGGLVAGLIIGVRALRDPQPFGRFLGAAAIVVATSLLGCAAQQYGGLLGVGLGVVSMTPALVFRRAAA